MPRFAKKKEVDVALKCQSCGDITNYPLTVFPRRDYIKDGYIIQWCGRCSNARHKIIGVFVEEQIPIKYDEAKELLGNLAE